VFYANHETLARAKSKKKIKNKRTRISRLSASKSKSTNKACQATASFNIKKRKGSKLANDNIHIFAQKPAKSARCNTLTDKSDTPLPVAQSTPTCTQPITDRSQAKPKTVEQFVSSSWFVPDDNHFTSAFAIRQIAMDGNCLFRAILSACGIDDEQYHEHLRAICVKEVIAIWDNLSTYANFIHGVDRDNIEELPFPNAQAYANYKGRVGEWGSDLEASVIAKKINRPLQLWIASTRRHGTLLNLE
jgi:hypothetical protein